LPIRRLFVLDPQGLGLLLAIPKGGTWLDVVEIALTSAAGIAALAFALQGWMIKKNSPIETLLFALAGLLLLFPTLVDALLGPLLGIGFAPAMPGLRVGLHVFVGLAAGAAAVALQRLRRMSSA
jgi:TRAP-type uncharacterized transport system fused permease subunit